MSQGTETYDFGDDSDDVPPAPPVQPSTPDAPAKNYYEVIGLTPENGFRATTDDIERIFLKRAMQRNANLRVDKLAPEVRSAEDKAAEYILRAPQRRRVYDRYLKADPEQGHQKFIEDTQGKSPDEWLNPTLFDRWRNSSPTQRRLIGASTFLTAALAIGAVMPDGLAGKKKAQDNHDKRIVDTIVKVLRECDSLDEREQAARIRGLISSLLIVQADNVDEEKHMQELLRRARKQIADEKKRRCKR